MSGKIRSCMFKAHCEYDDINFIKERMKYLIINKDIDTTDGSEFIRGYVEFFNSVTMKKIKTVLGGEKTEIEPWCDTVCAAISSCKLTDDYREYGTEPKTLSRIITYPPPPSTNATPAQLLKQIDNRCKEQFLVLKQHNDVLIHQQLKEAVDQLKTANAENFEKLSNKLEEKIDKKIDQLFHSFVHKFKLHLKQLDHNL